MWPLPDLHIHGLICRGIQETLHLTYKRILQWPVFIQALVERKRTWVEAVGKWSGIVGSWRNELDAGFLEQPQHCWRTNPCSLQCVFFLEHLSLENCGLGREAVNHTVPFNPELRQFTVGSLLAAKDHRHVLFTAYIAPLYFVFFFNFAFLLLSHLLLEVMD